jgi:hypothetical protein
MDNFHQTDSLFERIFSHLPGQSIQTFTPAQRKAIQSAVSKLETTRHPIDIRFTVPLFGKGFYVVTLIGLERRSPKRLRTGNPSYIFKSLIYASLVVSVVALVLVGFIWVVKQVTTNPSSETSYPTAIPGIDNEAECKNTRRSWRENQCWDNEWSHKF